MRCSGLAVAKHTSETHHFPVHRKRYRGTFPWHKGFNPLSASQSKSNLHFGAAHYRDQSGSLSRKTFSMLQSPAHRSPPHRSPPHRSPPHRSPVYRQSPIRLASTGALLSGFALLLSALLLSGCDGVLGQGDVLHVASGYVRLAATNERPSAGYFKVKGGKKSVTLVAVTADLAQRVEMHETISETISGNRRKNGNADGNPGGNAIISMREIRSAPVPAKGELVFSPGGKHLMIWNINEAAIRAGKLPMVFIFTNNDRIIFDMEIITPQATPQAVRDSSAR